MTSDHNLIRPVLAAAALFMWGAAAQAAEIRPARPPLTLAQNDADAPQDDVQSEAGLVVRITRLEGQLRQMNGQIEQLQFQNKRLEDQLRKMQQDVDFRFQDLGRAQPGKPAAQKRGDLGKPDPSIASADAGAAGIDPVPVQAGVPAPTPGSVPNGASVAPRQSRKGGDAFDPDADPSAPGAPKPIGTTAPSEPLPPRTAAAARPAGSASGIAAPGGPHAPMELMPNPALRSSDTAGLEPAPRAATPDAPAALPGHTRGDYDADMALFKAGQFDAAANGFQGFLAKYPKDRLAPEATYLLGESYARLGRQREAAEQFLKVSTDYTRSSRAPDALLRLGVALNALGAKEQACATYQEVDRKYPAASADVRASVERELKRARC